MSAYAHVCVTVYSYVDVHVRASACVHERYVSAMFMYKGNAPTYVNVYMYPWLFSVLIYIYIVVLSLCVCIYIYVHVRCCTYS